MCFLLVAFQDAINAIGWLQWLLNARCGGLILNELWYIYIYMVQRLYRRVWSKLGIRCEAKILLGGFRECVILILFGWSVTTTWSKNNYFAFSTNEYTHWYLKGCTCPVYIIIDIWKGFDIGDVVVPGGSLIRFQINRNSTITEF